MTVSDIIHAQKTIHIIILLIFDFYWFIIDRCILCTVIVLIKKLIFQLLMVLSKIKMCNLKLYKNVAHKKNLAFNGNKKIPYIKSRWNVLR